MSRAFDPVGSITGRAAVLRERDIDTDTIIRVDRYTVLPRDQLGPCAFESRRYLADGSDDPAWPLNRPGFRDAPILIAGENFGCGSSREAAVWALMALGLRAVIAPSFGGIFRNNCYQNGLLPIVLPAEPLAVLSDAASGGHVLKIDLGQTTIAAEGGFAVSFDIDALRHEAMMAGLDDLGLTAARGAEIAAWQARDRVARPWAWEPMHNSRRG